MYVASSPVEIASPTIALRPTTPAQRASIATRSPCRAARNAGGRGLGVAGDRDVDLERVGVGRLGDVADRVEDARQQEPELELVEQHPHALAVERALLQIGGRDAVEVDVARRAATSRGS